VTDELTAAQLDDFKNQLETLRVELESLLNISKSASDTVELDQPIGRISRIDAIQQQKMVAANRQRQRVRLQQCAAALKAMEEEEYGYCRRCDEPISLKRLRVRPEGPVCLQCQTALEAR